MAIPLLSRARAAIAEARDARASRRAAAELRRAVAALPDDLDADGVVDFLASESAALIWPWQIQTELRALARLVARRRPRVMLEIGTADGGTLFAHARLADAAALVISIDLPHGPFGGGYPAWRAPLYESFARPGQRLELLRADSHASSTGDLLERLLDGRRIDYAFIDGDHTYDGVRQDFELCRRFAASDAIIAFHDVAGHPEPEGRGVQRLWREIRPAFAHEEFVHDQAGQSYGIGVIHLGSRAGVEPPGDSRGGSP